MSIQITCLPVPGSYNPYQGLMIAGLNRADGVAATVGLPGRNFALYQSVKRDRPDYLHLDWIHSYYMHANPILQMVVLVRFLIEIQLLKSTDTKIVWTMHNLYPHRGGKNWWQHRLRRYFAHSCFWIRVFDEDTRETAIREFGLKPDKVRIVPEGSYAGFYPTTATTATARQRFGLNHEEHVVCYVGTIDAYKGVTELITAYGELPATVRKSSRLLIAGTAKDQTYLDRVREMTAADERIKLVEGYVANDELQYYFAAADVVCLPFLRIANSGSTILAMGFGKPVIAPSKGAVAYRLRQQPELLYQQDKDLKSQLLCALTMEKDALTSIGERNKDALQRHQWSDFADLFFGEELHAISR